MQDVIFGGGAGVQPRAAAEVEIVLDNSDGEIDLPLSEISIVRRLERSGEGGYLLNGARCRLADVLELLSDTGLGQARAIRSSRRDASGDRHQQAARPAPADRGGRRPRASIASAARRAQLKLERTQQNLDRALDIEREARSRLRPLRRQSEAAGVTRAARAADPPGASGARPGQRCEGAWSFVAGAERDGFGSAHPAQEIESRLAAVIAERTAAAQSASLAERTARHGGAHASRVRRVLAPRSSACNCARAGARGRETVGRRALRGWRTNSRRQPNGTHDGHLAPSAWAVARA